MVQRELAPEPAQVVVVSLDEELRLVAVEDRYSQALLVVRSRDAVLGHVVIPESGTISPERQREAIAAQIPEAVGKDRVRGALRRAALAGTPGVQPAEPEVSVVICTLSRPERLRECLASLDGLRTPPREVIVVDNDPADGRTKAACSEFGVRYVAEPVRGLSRARNRGILEAEGSLVAFTDDDCLVDPGWLDGLGEAFRDPLVRAITGYVGPAELETASQVLFETHGGFEMSFERRVITGRSSPVGGAAALGDGNAIFERSLFGEVGLFDEDMGPGTPARSKQDADIFYRLLFAGYRAVFDPGRIVWHRHRATGDELHATLVDYAVGSGAYALRCLMRDRDPAALRVLLWWWLDHLPADLRRLRGPQRVPLRLALAEAGGAARGPFAAWASMRRQGKAQPLPPPAETSSRTRAAVTGEMPQLSLVIPSHNRSRGLVEVLAGLEAQDYPRERFEAIVVLDGSTDRSREAVEARDWPFAVEVLEHARRGVAASRNRGADAAKLPVTLFFDDDLIPGPALLGAHAAAHARAKEDHVAFGYHPPEVGSDLWSHELRAWWEDHFRRKGEPGHVWTYPDFCSGNMSLPTALFRRYRFDDELRLRREEHELGIRLLQDGVPCRYYEDALGTHRVDTRLARAVQTRREEGASDVLIARKHPHLSAEMPFSHLGAASAGTRTAAPAAAPAWAVRGASAGGLRLARVLEGSRLRGRWWRLVAELMHQSYLRGATEACGGLDGLRELVSSAPGATAVHRLDLDDPAPPPVAVGTGSISLALSAGGRDLGTVEAARPGEQWDWETVTERAAEVSWRAASARAIRPPAEPPASA